MNMNEHILKNYNAATHSIIKEFVLAPDLNEQQRLARIAVIHAVMDSPEGNLSTYTRALLNVLTEGEADANYQHAHEAVKAVALLEVSGMQIITDYRLNEFGEKLIHAIAEAVTALVPERLLPMHNCTAAPDAARYTTANIEQSSYVTSNLCKNKMLITRKVAPLVFDALDALWSEQYTLNEDIMSLSNLPDEYLRRQFMIAASPAFSDTFSFRFTFDHRGRVYARSMYAQPQGDSFSKAILNMGTKKALGAKGLNALGIHYANVSGYDKLSLQERVQWARSQGMVKAIDMVNTSGDWAKIATHLESKEEKDGFEEYAAAMEYYNATNACDPTKFESNLVCHQDATNSGFQFGAALLGDLATARATNLLPSHFSETPEDLYLQVANSMLEVMDKDLLPEWEPYITRLATKKVVMVTGYGAGKASAVDAFIVGLGKVNAEHLISKVHLVTPFLFKALELNGSALLQLTALMKAHAKNWKGDQTIAAESIQWLTEDSFLVKHDYQDEEAYGKGKYKVVATRKAGWDANKSASALPPNFIHSIDGNMLRKAAIKARGNDIAFVPIHDSFGTHACDFFTLGHTLRQSFVEVMKYRWYASFINHNNIHAPTELSKGEFAIRDVVKSTYMFS